MSEGLNLIIAKLKNDNIEINCRAMENLDNKINQKLISLNQLNESMYDACLLALGKWFDFYLCNYTTYNYEEQFIIKSLNVFRQCLQNSPISSIQLLKSAGKVSNMMNSIGTISLNFRGIVDQILQILAKSAIVSPNEIGTISQGQGQSQNQNQQRLNNLTNSNSNTVSLTYSITRQEDASQLKNSTSRLSKRNDHNKSNMSNQSQPTFGKCIVTSQEEQKVFDLGINLKFGDALQLYRSFYDLYSQILNDFPIEYILQNDELLRAFFNILVQCNFLEFGVICYKILDKLFILIEKKITLCLNDSHSLKPGQSKEILIEDNCLSTIEGFLFYSITSLTKSLYDINKLAFYLSLVEKNYVLVQRLLLTANNWKEILYEILLGFDEITQHYKSKGFYPSSFFNFCLGIYANMPEGSLTELCLIDNVEVPALQFIKNIFFAVNESPITIQLMTKLEKIKGTNEAIESMIVDYNNANMVGKSIALTKEMFNPQSHFNPNAIIDNFYNVLLAIKYLNNNSQDDEYEKLVSSNQYPLIKIICDYYQKDTKNHKQKASDLLTKLLLFKKSEKIDSGLAIYNSILNEIKVKTEGIYPLFLSSDFISIILTDLTIKEYEDVILEIIFELYNNNEVVIQKEQQLRRLFKLLPTFGNNFKFTSLQSKIDSTLAYEEIMMKYLRFLFSRNENVRYNAINFFVKNNQGCMSDDSYMKKNYSEFKQVDTLLLIQTATNEFIKVNKAIITGGGLGTIDFMPLLNILYSTNMDYNIKASALEQLVLLVNSPCYKNYYVNEIIVFVIKELKDNEANVSNLNMSNYITSLLKILNIIVYTYFQEAKIQSLLSFSSAKDYLHVIITIALGKENNTTKHLMAAYALLYLFIFAFYERLPSASEGSQIPILKFFDSYYFINLIPCNMIPLQTTQHSSVLNFSITKNVIDYINYQKNPLENIFNLDEIKENIRQIKQLPLLDIFINITHLLSSYTVYSNTTDINDSLVQILFYFKKIIPKSNEERHLIMDFLNVLDIFLQSNNLTSQQNTAKAAFDQVLVFIPDIISNCLNYACIDREFITNLNGENQYFVYELLEFIIRNRTFLPIKRMDIITNFIEIYSNVLVFNQEGEYYQLKLHLIKFQALLIGSVNLSEKIYADTINTICFFLTKYEISGHYLNLNYITWTLSYLMQMLKMGKGKEILLSKSFIFVKLLSSPFIEVNVLSIQIIGMILNVDFFDKHGTILTEVFETVKVFGKHPQTKVIKTNYINFLIKTIDFIMKNKTIDSSSEKANDISNDLVIMNEKIFEESELIWLLSHANEADSIESSMIFKYIGSCLHLDSLFDEGNNSVRDNETTGVLGGSKRKLSKGIFFNWSFYEHVNEILVKETAGLTAINQINLDVDPVLNSTRNLNSSIAYSNKGLKNKVMVNSSIENVLNVKEGLTLIIRSFPLMTKSDFERYNSIIAELFINFVKFNDALCNIWYRWNTENSINQSLIKVIQTYTLTYFSFLQFVFELPFDKEFIPNMIINNSLVDLQLFYEICYQMLKLDCEKCEYNLEIKMMYAKVLPYIVELQQEYKTNAPMVDTIKSGSASSQDELKEKDTLAEIITTLNTVYEIKIEMYDSKVNCLFKIENKNIKAKNDLLNAINSLVLTSQSCKVTFVQLKVVNSFIDYIKQLTDSLLNESLSKQSSLDDSSTEGVNLNYILSEYNNVLMLFQNLLANFMPCRERDELFMNSQTGKKGKLIKMLYDIVHDVVRYPSLFDNYLKLLINILSNDGELAKYFLLQVNKSKDTLLNAILSFFNKNFNMLSSMQSFSLFFQFIKCLFQYKSIADSLQKGKFVEEMKSEIIKIIINKKTYANPKMQLFLQELMVIFVSLSFDTEFSRKLANKDFVLHLSEVLLKTKNEQLIYNIIFFFRNICFVNTNKVTFMSNESLLGSVFALFSGDSTSLKIKYIISHLLWVLLYNNQTLKTLFNKEEFKGELRGIYIHLQKEVDMEKFGEKKHTADNLKHLQETCLNMRKIMHILEV